MPALKTIVIVATCFLVVLCPGRCQQPAGPPGNGLLGEGSASLATQDDVERYLHRIMLRGSIIAKNGGIIGVSDHGGWAVLVSATRDGVLLDRRRIELVDADLPKLPHHHEGQGLPIDQAVELVERVRVSAERHAVLALDAVSMAVPRILGVALRACRQLPSTIAARIKDYRARNVADWVMYRKAVASAAEGRGWPVHWYETKSVLGAASQALQVANLDAHFLAVRRAAGPPWDKDHKLAMAAAIVAASAMVE